MLDLKARFQKEWIVYIIQLLLIGSTFFFGLDLFRHCDCCFITKIVVQILLILAFLFVGLYLLHLSNEVDVEKTTKILLRFQNLKLITFLMLITTWVLMTIISINSLEKCGVENKGSIHIDNRTNNKEIDTVNYISNGNYKKTDTIVLNVKQQPIQPVTNIKNYVTYKRDTIKIIQKTESKDSVYEGKYLALLKEINRKISDLEKKKVPSTTKIEVRKLKIKRNRNSDQLEIFKDLQKDSVDIKANKIKVYHNEISTP